MVVYMLWEFIYSPKICYTINMPVKKKRCKYCLKLYSEDSFGVALTTQTKVYRRLKCRHCYRSTKQNLIQRNYQWLTEYKRQRGCNKCGINNPIVLDFHHKNERDKLFTVSSFRRAVGFNRIENEIKKCEIVCANCHRILHDEIKNSEIINKRGVV